MTLWLDVTSSLRWQWRPVGIIRVESEIARAFLGKPGSLYKFCYFDSERHQYCVVSRSLIEARLARIADNSTSITHSQPRRTPVQRILQKLLFLRRLPGHLGRKLSSRHLGGFATRAASSLVDETMSTPVLWRKGDVYISVGIDWDDKDYDLLLHLKRKHHLRTLLCSYDLIPVLYPELTVAATAERFPAYLKSMAKVADNILAISKCTRDDLIAYFHSQALGTPRTTLIQLGMDIPSLRSAPPISTPALQQLQEHGPFILMVSTIEARKGHAVLFNAYRKLLEDGHKDLPQLVWAGMKGWGVDGLFADLEANPSIANKITILGQVSDEELGWLYQNCLFTVFPSRYEGWGLPVSESLTRGKFCLASRMSSIPEAGGNFCEYLDPLAHIEWAERIAFLTKNKHLLATKEARIHQFYRPHAWSQTAQSVVEAANQLMHETTSTL